MNEVDNAKSPAASAASMMRFTPTIYRKPFGTARP
jgi:hypothetical protein